MNPCDESVIKTLRYLENDLEGKELGDFRLHLESCAECRAHLEAEKALSRTLHRSRPLYSAPAALRDRVAAAVIQHAVPDDVPDRVDQRAFRIFGNGRQALSNACRVGGSLLLRPLFSHYALQSFPTLCATYEPQ